MINEEEQSKGRASQFMRMAVFLVVFVFWMFRFAGLSDRPMHGDEANQAVRTGQLLEQGVYHYDPADHHGPVLYYAALPFCRAITSRFADTTEVNFRLVPVVFSLLTLLLIAGCYRKDGTGLFKSRITAWFAVLLVAVSPAMNYYSRFFIQETMFVTFLAGILVSAIHYARVTSSRGKILWAGGVGVFTGLAVSTKETVVLSLAAAFVAGIATLATRGLKTFRETWSWRDAIVAVCCAVFIDVLFYSSFFTYPQGVYDELFSTVKTYMTRATAVPEHQHPWDFYLKFLFGWHYGRGPVWREINFWFLLPLAFAVIMPFVECVRLKQGDETVYARMFRARWTLFVVVYTLVLTILYACIPYKTPWCILSFLFGYLILVARGVEYLVEFLLAPRATMYWTVWCRGVFLILLVVCGVGVCLAFKSSWNACFKYAADIRNPYVYAHTGRDAMNLVAEIERAAREKAGQGQGMYDVPIAIVSPPSDYWPLPFYLRKFNAVGYWSTVDEIPAEFKPELLIISASMGDQASRIMGKETQSNFFGIRPGTLLLFFERKQ
jgi:uncharacterized protein (TIGR03663 family)